MVTAAPEAAFDVQISLTCFIMECREMVGKLNSRSIIVKTWQFLEMN